ncbi:hypothetical protein P7C70_g1661, partial [Phenoliferia sp. Uapishka_3]
MITVTSPQLRESISSHTPLQFDSSNSPYLAFPTSSSPFLSSLRLTPPRQSDASALVSTLNSPLVYKSLRSPPYPYLPHHATAVIGMGMKAAQALIDQWERNDWSTPEGCPLNTIRAMRDDGEEVWVGALGVRRWPFDEVVDPVEKEEKVREMMARKAEDPEVVWTVGFYIDPTFNGRGVMTQVLRTLIDSYMIPALHATKIRATVYVGNIASRRVFEKNGFELVGTAWVNEGESRGGKMREEWWFEWSRET